MANLDVWKDYVTVINAARLNAIKDQIMTNEGNISYQQTLINANTTSIYTNTNNIANLSDIKLSRDGSQPMTGELVCNAGLKTNVISTISSTPLDCQQTLRVDTVLGGSDILGLVLEANFNFNAPQIGLYPYDSNEDGKILIETPSLGGSTVPRIEIPGKSNFVDIKIREANLIPYDNNYQDLGTSSKKWRGVYAIEGYFDRIVTPRAMPFYLESPSSSDKYLLGAGTVSTMYQFNTTVTLIGYKLMMLTSASNGYIKVTIDDANGWNYEKTYSLGSAGGYRYNESFIHIIETDNGIQLKISNCSQISSTSIVLEYK